MKHCLPLLACYALGSSLCLQVPKVLAADDVRLACRERPVLPEGRARVGLALGGGGARGIAHISVLRKLEQMHVPIDCIAGTSMGALVGAMYASGMTVDEIEKAVLALDWAQLFDDSLERRERSYRRKRDDELVVAAPGVGIGSKGVKIAAGLLAGERILLLFEKMIEPVSTIEDFDQLPIPYRAVAADINNGEPLIIQDGDLALAMRASMSIPGVFPPVQIGEHVAVDGGVARNIPIDVVRGMGADIIIAVDVGTPLTVVTPQSSVLAITGQVTGLLTVRNTREQLATLTQRDVLISPPLGDRVATADFLKGSEALAIGKAGAEAASERIATLSLPDEAYAQNVSIRTGRLTTPPIVQFVRLENGSQYRDDLVLSGVDIPVGEPLDSVKLEASLHRLYGLNTLSLSTYEVVKENGETGVVVHVNEKVQGPNYLEAGLSMSGDLQGRFDFNVRFGILHSPINDSGGEMRYLLQLGDEPGLLAEYYQPFGALGPYFFAGRAQYEHRQINVFDDIGRKLVEYDARQSGFGLGFGREFGNYGALTIAVRRFTGKAEVQIGDPSLPDIDTDTGETFVDFTIDRLDSFYFPRHGYTVRTQYVLSREALGADANFEQFDLDAIVARTFGKHSAQLGLRYHVTTSGVAPLQSLYRVGGYTRLVGFQPNELADQSYAVLLAGYSYQIGEAFNQEALVGGMLEYGNVWENRSDMGFDDGVLNGSIYIGLDSWIGPILFGIGGREGGERNLFLELGHRF
jgi:NTE family protein